MKIKLKHAPTYAIDPNKKYVVMIIKSPDMTEDDQSNFRQSFGNMFPNVLIEFLPSDSKYKIVEASNG